MRLIDADEMIKNLKAMKTMYDAIELDGMIKGLEESKTVDAEPVRHGRWEIVIVSTSNPYESEIEEKCSLCGRFVQRYGTQPQDNYCPNCGAKMMDGGKQDD